jgi:hypothetical protein
MLTNSSAQQYCLLLTAVKLLLFTQKLHELCKQGRPVPDSLDEKAEEDIIFRHSFAV